MGSGISHSDEQIVQSINESLNDELIIKIKKLKESGMCHPDYINYAIYLLKTETNYKQKSVESFNENKSKR
jgi:hypothetical protein